MPELVDLQCQIRRSAFSGERIIEFKNSLGSEHKAVVPVRYLRLSDGQQLSEDTPSRNASVSGIVRIAKIVQADGSTALALPDGEVVPE